MSNLLGYILAWLAISLGITGAALALLKDTPND